MPGAGAERLSIVVPALNEAGSIAPMLRALAPLRGRGHEVIVVDGGSEDGTVALAAGLADRVLRAPRGRARQMNAGAAAARGEILFFLHADSIVPRGFAAAIASACEQAIGGRFDVDLAARGARFRMIENAINLRSRWSGLFTGDQGLFIRRDAFAALGGYPDQPLLEDLALAHAMKRHGHVAALRERILTSARRWQRHGTLRTLLLMWRIRGLYALGVPPERLAHLYRDAR